MSTKFEDALPKYKTCLTQERVISSSLQSIFVEVLRSMY